MSIVPVPKRALILGGGGAVGVAWEIGLLAGLRDAGVDVTAADVIVGTSAGSVVGAQIASGRDPRDLLAALREQQMSTANGDAPVRDMEAAGKAFGIWGSSDEMTPERCAEVGAVALRANTVSEADYLAQFSGQAPDGWPKRPLIVTSVDCQSGALRAIDASDGVPLHLAISASCAVPTLFPPVTIEGRRYMDGGVRSGTSADLALPFKPDVALIIAPLGSGDRGIHPLCRRQAESEARQLEAIGAAARIVHMDAAAMAAGGANLMDVTARIPAANAGYAHGVTLADDLRATWDGARAAQNAPSGL